MDPALALIPLGVPPRAADAQVLVLPGAFLPVLLPLACYAPDQRITLLRSLAEVPPGTRVQAALDAGRTTEAWAEAASWPGPALLSGPTGLAAHFLAAWGRRSWPGWGWPRPRRRCSPWAPAHRR